MHAAIVLDRERLAEEYAPIGRVVVALMADGCRITRVVPEAELGDDDPSDRPMGLSGTLGYAERVPFWLRRDRANGLADALDRRPPDVIWARGHVAWSLAIDVADLIDKPVVLDLDGAASLRALRAHRRAPHVVGLTAASEPIARAAREGGFPAPVAVVPAGVATSDEPGALRETRTAEDALIVVVLGPQRDARAYRSLFGAVRVLREEGAPIEIVLEVPRGPAGARPWREARRAGLAAHVTVLGPVAQFRRLVAACDLVVRPEPEARVRTVVLEAMAGGAAVVSVPDPFLDHLDPRAGTTVLADEAPDANAWIDALRPLVTDRARREEAQAAARRFVSERHGSSGRSRRLFDLFTSILDDRPIPFAGP